MPSLNCVSQSCNPIIFHEDKASPEVKERMKEWIVTNEQLKQYKVSFIDNIERGLKKATHDDAIVKCFPTYVQDLPTGKEKGKFLALDLGGTNFRVLLIELDGDKFDMKSKTFVMPNDVITGTGTQLFDHIAKCMAEFTESEKISDQRLPLGFTFSFPLMQKGLTVGVLERWTKGFSASDVIDHDVVQLLNEAIERNGKIQIDVCAILNDTTGTLISCAWKNHETRIGLIVGTGSNACYVEKQSKAELFDEADSGSGNVLINLEWGAFGDDGALDFVRNDFDRTVDGNSINPGKQQHEKMISGMYMGELVRLVLVKLAEDGLLNGGQVPPMLAEKDRFYTKYVSEIENDAPGCFENVKEVCEEIGMKNCTEQDYYNIRYVCECVSRRAAHLVSAGVATLLERVGEKKQTVGIDGSVYRYHPHFHNLMVEKIKELVDPSIQFSLMLSEDGSGRGAALVAACAANTSKKN